MQFRSRQPWKTNRAQALRSSPERAEEIMWSQLRDRRLGDFKFVRQAPIGPYFADFACRSAKVVVEIDGATHGEAAEISRDDARTAYLRTQGYSVFRTRNTEVFQNLNGVLDTLLAILRGEAEIEVEASRCPSSGPADHLLPARGEKEERTR